MIKTTKMLLQEFAQFANPKNKISRLVMDGKLVPIAKGLYETNKDIAGQYLAASICGPSYLSFEYALAYYGLIPEAARVFTSATFCKRKKKKFSNYYGAYTYQDVPKQVFSLGVELKIENEYAFTLATPEKAICDMLYTLAPIKNQADLRALLFDDLRIYLAEFDSLNKQDIFTFADCYKSSNVRLLASLIKKG